RIRRQPNRDVELQRYFNEIDGKLCVRRVDLDTLRAHVRVGQKIRSTNGVFRGLKLWHVSRWPTRVKRAMLHVRQHLRDLHPICRSRWLIHASERRRDGDE